MSCPCVGGGQCIDGYLTPNCIYPLGRIEKQCRVLFNPCSEVKCANGGICVTLDERQKPKKLVCSCQNGYYGTHYERIGSQIHIEFSSSLSLKGLQSELISVFIHFLKLSTFIEDISFHHGILIYIPQFRKSILYTHNYTNYIS